ncbi:hypothetical protein ACWEF9_36675 [Streptomyces sp. NPDC004980]
MAAELLAHAADMLDDRQVTSAQLRYIVARMAEDLCATYTGSWRAGLRTHRVLSRHRREELTYEPLPPLGSGGSVRTLVDSRLMAEG